MRLSELKAIVDDALDLCGDAEVMQVIEDSENCDDYHLNSLSVDCIKLGLVEGSWIYSSLQSPNAEGFRTLGGSVGDRPLTVLFCPEHF